MNDYPLSDTYPVNPQLETPPKVPEQAPTDVVLGMTAMQSSGELQEPTETPEVLTSVEEAPAYQDPALPLAERVELFYKSLKHPVVARPMWMGMRLAGPTDQLKRRTITAIAQIMDESPNFTKIGLRLWQAIPEGQTAEPIEALQQLAMLAIDNRKSTHTGKAVTIAELMDIVTDAMPLEPWQEQALLTLLVSHPRLSKTTEDKNLFTIDTLPRSTPKQRTSVPTPAPTKKTESSSEATEPDLDTKLRRLNFPSRQPAPKQMSDVNFPSSHRGKKSILNRLVKEANKYPDQG